VLWSDVGEQTWTIPRFAIDGDADPDPDARQASDADPVAGPDAPLILVVDDDLANLALAEALLRAEGFRVRLAMDAASALKALKEAPPALILMDIQLPEVDGWELTRQIKADPATTAIPVIAITAYGQEGDDRRANAVGFIDFLAKPISTRTLPDIIRHHLQRR
jgi:CheY-like chemotaxis protein